jgi:bifunctional UDP-N-acetylglucosamine pyrophosphorylase/glucosamine-1-phosphate N-acetyltransferase
MENVQVVILAAGKGKRMNQPDLPKVLVPFAGKPMIRHVVEAVAASGVCARPVIVVGQKAEMVEQELGAEYAYAHQAEQLGTGHAVATAQSVVPVSTKTVLVLYGDHPMIQGTTIRQLVEAHEQSGSVVTMATFTVPDFNEWRAGFYDFGRVLRDANGAITGSVEKKDATPEQLAITELNPCYFCFSAPWLWEHLAKLKNANAQQEYYLTDVVAMAVAEGKVIGSVTIEPKEALGVNTVEQLDLLHQL